MCKGREGLFTSLAQGQGLVSAAQGQGLGLPGPGIPVPRGVGGVGGGGPFLVRGDSDAKDSIVISPGDDHSSPSRLRSPFSWDGEENTREGDPSGVNPPTKTRTKRRFSPYTRRQQQQQQQQLLQKQRQQSALAAAMAARKGDQGDPYSEVDVELEEGSALDPPPSYYESSTASYLDQDMERETERDSEREMTRGRSPTVRYQDSSSHRHTDATTDGSFQSLSYQPPSPPKLNINYDDDEDGNDYGGSGRGLLGDR